MKERSKFLILIAMLCVMIMTVSVIVSAFNDEASIDYEAQLKPTSANNVIADYDATVEWGSNGTLKNLTENAVGVTANGNNYRIIRSPEGAIIPTSETGTYTSQLPLYEADAITSGEYAFKYENAVSNLYTTLDFDFTVSGYTVKTTESGKTVYRVYAPDELPNGVSPEDSNVDLAIVSGTYLSNTVSFTKGTAPNITKDIRSTQIYILKDSSSGEWYYANASTLASATKTIKMSENPDVFDHITVVYYTKTQSGQNSVFMSYYINGEFLYNKSCVPYAQNAITMTLGGISFNWAKKSSNPSAHSFGIDNLALNFYGASYKSSGYGVDDVYSSSAMDFENQIDTVYSKDYISANGYMQIKNPSGNRSLVSVPSVVKSEYAYIENGATIETTMSLYDIDVPDGIERITVKCEDYVEATLSADALASGYVINKIEGGYEIKYDPQLVTLNWYDSQNRLILTEKLPIGFAPDTASSVKQQIATLDGDTLIVESDITWKWDLDGEVGVISPDKAVKDQVISLTVASSTVTRYDNASFVMGNLSEDGKVFTPVPASDGTFTFYENATGDDLISEISKSTYGNTCRLLDDFTGFDGEAAAITPVKATALAKNQTFNLDLNGHTLAKVGKLDTDDNYIFLLSEKTTFNVYSSVAGGIITNTIFRENAGRFNSVHSTLFAIDASVNTATLNVGEFYDGEGNKIYDGNNLTAITGTLAYVKYTANSQSDESKIYVNIIGGTYFLPYRAQSGIVCTRSCDTVMTLDGVKIYSTYTTGILNEYSGNNTQGTVAVVKNSEIYASYLFHTTQYGEYYLENNVIATTSAQAFSLNGGSITLGKGNVIAGAYSNNFFTYEGLSYQDGVDHLRVYKAGDCFGDQISTFTHSTAAQSWSSTFNMTYKEGFDGSVDSTADTPYIDTVTLKQSAINMNVSSELIYEILCYTFTAEEFPEEIGRLDWHNGDNVEHTYQIVGTIAEAPYNPVDAGYPEIVNTWYKCSYVWDKAEANDMKVDAGVNNFVIEAKNVANIDNLKANVTLADGMIFNFYLPVPDEGISNVSVSGASTYGIADVAGLGERFVISAILPLDTFSPTVVILSFTADGQDVTITLTADALKYSTIVANSYLCGTDEAALVSKLVAYKLTVLDYLEIDLSEDEAIALEKFEKIYEKHASCACLEAFDSSVISEAEKNVTCSTALNGKVTDVSYLLSPTSIGIRIGVASGCEVTEISYLNINGERKSLELEVEDGYYVARGLAAPCATAILTITVSESGNLTSGTYSLGSYIINNPSLALTKSLYQYSMAAKNYRLVTNGDSKYTVSFDSNGGTPVPSIAVAKGSAIINTPIPEMLGYGFAGWTLNGEAYDLNTPVNSDLTLTATWERVEDGEVFSGLQSILLMGQSNMIGRGDPLTVDPIDDDRLYMLRGDKWWKMTEPLHTNTTISGTGLAPSFGKAFVDTFDCEVGLIPAAKGSTTIDMWAVGGDLYNEAVRLAKVAKESSNICAILWHQGESSMSDVKYAAKLEVILDSLIEEVGLDPDKIVIITGEIFEGRSAYQNHSDQIHMLADAYKYYGVASSKGLTVFDETTHFDGHSLRLFGYRYFDVFYNIVTEKQYDYVDDPMYYYSEQEPVDENYHMHFEDMALGSFGHPYNNTISGSSRITVSLLNGSLVINEDENGNRYAVMTNGQDPSTGKYNYVYLNTKQTMDTSRVFVLEANYKLVDGVKPTSAGLLRVISSNTNLYTLYLASDGKVYATKGTSTTYGEALTTLTTDEWTNFKVVLDFENNTKKIYVNNEFAFECVLSETVDLDSFVISTIRVVGFEGKGTGSIALDEYKCYYADAE